MSYQCIQKVITDYVKLEAVTTVPGLMWNITESAHITRVSGAVMLCIAVYGVTSD